MKDLIYSIIIGILVVGIFCLANYTKDCPDVKCNACIKDPNAIYGKYKLVKDYVDDGEGVDTVYRKDLECDVFRKYFVSEDASPTAWSTAMPYEKKLGEGGIHTYISCNNDLMLFFDDPEDLKIINEYFTPIYE